VAIVVKTRLVVFPAEAVELMKKDGDLDGASVVRWNQLDRRPSLSTRCSILVLSSAKSNIYFSFSRAPA